MQDSRVQETQALQHPGQCHLKVHIHSQPKKAIHPYLLQLPNMDSKVLQIHHQNIQQLLNLHLYLHLLQDSQLHGGRIPSIFFQDLEDSKVHLQLQHHKRLCLVDSHLHGGLLHHQRQMLDQNLVDSKVLASTFHTFLQHHQRLCLNILLQHLAYLSQLEAKLHLLSQMTFRAVWTLQKVGLEGPKLGIHGRIVLGMVANLDSSGPMMWIGAYTDNMATTQVEYSLGPEEALKG